MSQIGAQDHLLRTSSAELLCPLKQGVSSLAFFSALLNEAALSFGDANRLAGLPAVAYGVTRLARAGVSASAVPRLPQCLLRSDSQNFGDDGTCRGPLTVRSERPGTPVDVDDLPFGDDDLATCPFGVGSACPVAGLELSPLIVRKPNPP